MTTAGRPTYFAKVGTDSFTGMRSYQVSGKDLNAHMKLKFRQVGQNSTTETISKDYRSELDQKEQLYIKSGNSSHLNTISQTINEPISTIRLLQDIKPIVNEVSKNYDDADFDDGNSDEDFSSR